MADKNTIKNWFRTDLMPSQAQFWALFDSYFHKDEKIPITAIEDIETILNAKADAEVLAHHLTATDAHAGLFGSKVDKVIGKSLIWDTEIAKLINQSGINSGNETAGSIITKIGDGTKIDQSYLPSYVDDVLEFTNLAGFPTSGESGKIYIAINSSKQYRWTGSAYLPITNGLIATTNDVPESSTKLYVAPSEKLTWNGKQNDLGFIPENPAYKTSNINGDSTTYLNTPAVKAYVDSIPTGFRGGIDLSSPTPNVIGIYVPTVSGTYTNFGGLVVDLTLGLTTISFDGAVYKKQVVPITLTNYIQKGGEFPTWTATTYTIGLKVSYLGKYWKSNAATLVTDIPGTSSKWDSELTAKVDKTDLYNASSFLNLIPNANKGLALINIGIGGAPTIEDGIPRLQYQTGTPVAIVVNKFDGFNVAIKSTLKVGDRTIYYSPILKIDSGVIDETFKINGGIYVKVPTGYTGAIDFSFKTSGAVSIVSNYEFLQLANGWRYYRFVTSTLINTADKKYFLYLNMSNVSGSSTADIYISAPTVIRTDGSITPGIYNGREDSLIIAQVPDVNKADLVAGKNLFNLNALDNEAGFYIDANGIKGTSASYLLTGYISVNSNTWYYPSVSNRIVFYDANRVYISGIDGTRSTPQFQTPTNAVYVRCSILQSSVSSFQLELGQVGTIYENYLKKVPTNQLDLTAYTKTTDLANNFAKLTAGKNLFNKLSGLVVLGSYVNSTSGAYATNGAYSATGNIPIPIGSTQVTLSYKHQIAFFNSTGTYISGSPSTDLNITQTIPNGAAFINCTVLYAGIDSFMISVGTILPALYQAYKTVIAPANLEVFSSQIILDVPLAANIFRVFLPKEICIAVGRTIELYHNQISFCGNINDYYFLWSGIGKSMKRKWSCTGVTIGTNILTLKVYDKNNALIATVTTTVKVASATIVTPFTICPIGDSLSNQKPWYSEVKTLAANNISFVGTRVSQTQEGRSGATAAQYLTNFSYTFDTNGIVGIDGKTQDLNPFYNTAVSNVDFAYYKSNYSQNPNKLIIWLGTNGITIDPSTNATSIKTFIDRIRVTGGATIPIFVVHTLFRGNQNGLGLQTGTDGYVVNTAYKLEEDLKVFNLQERMLSDLNGYANVYLIPVSTCHDSEFNFGQTVTPVNPRATQTELMPIEATHPQLQGYNQIADIIFSSLAVNQ